MYHDDHSPFFVVVFTTVVELALILEVVFINWVVVGIEPDAVWLMVDDEAVVALLVPFAIVPVLFVYVLD